MTVLMIIFVGFILVWGFTGLMMILTMNRNGINWFGIIFLLTVPFIPLVAKICEIL